MRKSPKFSPEVIERAVRMVFDAKDQYPSQWAVIESIAAKIGCTGETLRKWVCQDGRDSGVRPGATTAEQQPIVEPQRKASDYDACLSKKVEMGKAPMRAGLGRSNDKVEAGG